MTRIGRVPVRVTTGNDVVFEPTFFVTPVVYSLTPNSGKQGQTLNVAITGEGFVSGVTTATFGGSYSGITVNFVTVSGPKRRTPSSAGASG